MGAFILCYNIYMELTSNEKEIINILRELKPFERVEVIKDQMGKLDHYLIHRSQKIILTKTT